MRPIFHIFGKRDTQTENHKQYGRNRRLYDHHRQTPYLEEAVDAIRSNADGAVLIALPLSNAATQQYGAGQPTYAVAVHHYGKYKHTDYTGDTDWLNSYDLITTKNAGALERIVDREGKDEHTKEIHVGILVDHLTQPYDTWLGRSLQ